MPIDQPAPTVAPGSTGDSGGALLAELQVLRTLEENLDRVQRKHAAGVLDGQVVKSWLFPGSDSGIDRSPMESGIIELTPRDPHLDFCPPEFRGTIDVQLPTDLAAARDALRELNIDCPPERIDIYQLGALACRLATGETVQAYLSSLTVASRLSPVLRSLIDDALGHRRERQIRTLEEFRDRVSKARQQLQERVNAETPAGASPQKSDEVSHGKPSTTDPLPFERLGHYQILSRIGRGGMGDVYLGHDPGLDRPVAIKVLPAELAREPEFLARFKRESAAAARLTHPNIVNIYFAGTDGGHLFFAMQLVEGTSLAELLRTRTRLDVTETLQLVRQLLAALEHAHTSGMVHRDIKPGNILLDRRLQRALLADFGLVKTLQSEDGQTITGTVLGTADYLSPEQGQGRVADHRSDLYSLGVVMYLMLSGRLPFYGDSASAVIFQHVYAEPTPLRSLAPDVPEPIAAIVSRLMAKSPADRFQSSQEVLRAINQASEQRTIESAELAELLDNSSVTSASQVIAAPFTAVECDEPDALVHGPVASRWQQFRNKALSVVGRISPEVRQQLETTQQQVDGVLQDYERRRQILKGCLVEAEQVLADLRKELRTEKAAPAPGEGPSLRAPVLMAEILRQESELESMRLQFQKVTASLDRLQRQRDLLQARLHVAQARAGHFEPAPSPSRSRKYVKIGAALSVVTLLVAILAQQRWPANLAPFLPASLGFLARARVPTYEDRNLSTPDDFRQSSAFVSEASLEFSPTCVALSPKISISTKTMTLFAGANDGRIFQLTINRPDGGTFGSGAVTSSYRPLFSHTSPVTSLTTSADGRLLAVGHQDGLIQIWQPRASSENQLYQTLRGHTEEVQALVFNANGTQLLSQSGWDRSVRLWDVIEARQLQIFHHDLGVHKVYSSGRGGGRSYGNWTYLPGTSDWLRAPGDSAATILGHEGKQHDGPYYQFQGNNLLVTQLDSPIRNLNRTVDPTLPTSNKFIAVAPPLPGDAHVFGSDIRQASVATERPHALAATWSYNLELWDLVTGKLVQTVYASPPETRSRVYFQQVVISPDATFGVTFTGNRKAQVWKLQTPKPVALLERLDMDTQPLSVAFAPDGQRVAIGVRDGVRAWLIGGKAGVNQLESVEISLPVTALEFAQNGYQLAMGTGLPGSPANYAAFRTIAGWASYQDNWNVSRRFDGHRDLITGVALINRQRHLVTGSRDGTLRYWSTQEGRQTGLTEIGEPVTAISASPDNQRLLVGTESGEVLVVDLQKHRIINRLSGHTLPVRGVRWSSDGEVFATTSVDRTVRVWNGKTFETLAVLEGHTEAVNAAYVSRPTDSGRFVISASNDKSVRVWHLSNPKESHQLIGHTAPVISLDVDRSEQKLATVGAEPSAQIWSLAEIVKAFPLTASSRASLKD